MNKHTDVQSEKSQHNTGGGQMNDKFSEKHFPQPYSCGFGPKEARSSASQALFVSQYTSLLGAH